MHNIDPCRSQSKHSRRILLMKVPNLHFCFTAKPFLSFTLQLVYGFVCPEVASLDLVSGFNLNYQKKCRYGHRIFDRGIFVTAHLRIAMRLYIYREIYILYLFAEVYFLKILSAKPRSFVMCLLPVSDAIARLIFVAV